MLNLLNNPTFDNERNILNADLFVNNLKNTLKSFNINPKVTYDVYRSVTVYNITLNDDNDYNDILKLKKEIALSLGLRVEEFKIEKVSDSVASIKVNNMKKDNLSLKELLLDFKKDDSFKIALGLDEFDNVINLDLDKDRNLLVTGVTGSGKTNLFNSCLMNILVNYSSTKVIIMDSTGINYNIYSDVFEVINKEELIIDRIKALRKEFEARVKNDIRDRIVVFIDEIYEIIKVDNSVKDDINYLLELGSMMNINFVISSDSIMEDDINNLFNRSNLSKLSFYLTSRGEYNMFLGKVVREDLNRDGMYLNSDNNLTRIMVPIIDDDEIERCVDYAKKGKQ